VIGESGGQSLADLPCNFKIQIILDNRKIEISILVSDLGADLYRSNARIFFEMQRLIVCGVLIAISSPFLTAPNPADRFLPLR
jgi:hypothetical protein